MTKLLRPGPLSGEWCCRAVIHAAEKEEGSSEGLGALQL